MGRIAIAFLVLAALVLSAQAIRLSPKAFAAAIVPDVLLEISNSRSNLVGPDRLGLDRVAPMGALLQQTEITEKDLAPLIKEYLHAAPESLIESSANMDEAAFKEFREDRAMSYDLSLEDYDSAHEEYRVELLAVAESLDVSVNQQAETYADVLAKIEDAAARRVRAAKASLIEVEAETADSEDEPEAPHGAAAAAASLNHKINLESLRTGAALFSMRATLLEAASDDIVTRNMATDLDASVQGVIKYMKENRCSICKRLRQHLPDIINQTLIQSLKLNRSVAEEVGNDACAHMLEDNDPSFKIFGPGLCQYPVRVAYQFSQWFALGTRNVTIRSRNNETLSAKNCLCQSFAPTMVFPRMRIYDLQVNPQIILQGEAGCPVDRWSTQCLAA